MNEQNNDLMTPFQIAVKIQDHERRIKEQEDDMKAIKPIVYDTAGSVKQIERSVSKMEENSNKIRGYFLAASITAVVGGAIGLVFFVIQSGIGGN